MRQYWRDLDSLERLDPLRTATELWWQGVPARLRRNRLLAWDVIDERRHGGDLRRRDRPDRLRPLCPSAGHARGAMFSARRRAGRDEPPAVETVIDQGRRTTPASDAPVTWLAGAKLRSPRANIELVLRLQPPAHRARDRVVQRRRDRDGHADGGHGADQPPLDPQGDDACNTSRRPPRRCGRRRAWIRGISPRSPGAPSWWCPLSVIDRAGTEVVHADITTWVTPAELTCRDRDVRVSPFLMWPRSPTLKLDTRQVSRSDRGAR